ncbi:hypothetical protein Golax_005159 [Gossypium laxum]|uniref:Uncharacterized protein n=1 Tax=Gossypium laxum TaxID=34288 RepID=A0A7J8ZZW0_9ROSI|nr:hypothetical protein [Gossypium laxum]
MFPRTPHRRPSKKPARGASSTKTIPLPLPITLKLTMPSKDSTHTLELVMSISCPLDFYFVTNQLEFEYLGRLHDWGWLHCLQLRGVCYENLVRSFYSNAKFDYGSNGQIIASSPHMLWEKRLKFLPLSLRNTTVFPTRLMVTPTINFIMIL